MLSILHLRPVMRSNTVPGTLGGDFSLSKAFKIYRASLIILLLLATFPMSAFAGNTTPAPGTADHKGEDMWTTANRIIVDIYNQIAGISTVLAGLMSAVAVIGAKMSNNQHKVDQAWDWLKRIWIAWVIINGIGAFLAYVRPLLSGLNTIT